ncbi:hypothetical protein JAO73_19445 [Hymenobacter sp. BT523]|uniref:hypothetical protein n=1 Tax=Hymenobacter sp. BT523 TaxID=2795725 RepID=UPI0018EBAB38|nr:hypothetical protein [Hymenobacter sp. BT523]MBJ6111205.1 hypothetical protein [Hymenobacter sp. BT523]
MRLILLVAALGALVISALLALVFGFGAQAAVAHLGQVAYFEYYPDGPQLLALSAAHGELALLRGGIWAVAGGSALVSVALLRMDAFRGEFRLLGQEMAQVRLALKRTLVRLTKRERALGATVLVSLLALQLGWLLTDSLSPDELVSYDAFVHQGPVAITSFYPIPNNHVLYNLLCWPLKLLLPGQVRLIMRLPSLLTATLGVGLGYLLLTHFRGFRVATLATALFGLSTVSLTYAASGRGYFLQLTCLLAAFFAVFCLVTHRPCRRLAWATFILSCTAGLYAVPTFAVPLLALAAGLLVAGARSGASRRALLAQTGAALAAIGLLTALLYYPVGCISGWQRLLANRYLEAHSLAAFLASGKAYLYETAGLLYGPPRGALLLWAAVALGTPALLARPGVGPDTRWLAGLCWALLVLPAPVMLARQFYIPARVLLFTTYFLYVLLALAADWAWRHQSPRGLKPVVGGLLLGIFVVKLAAIKAQVPVLLRSRARAQEVTRAYNWLSHQPGGPVFVGTSYHGLLFYHLSLLAHRPLPLLYTPTGPIRYVVWGKEQAANRPIWAKNLPLQPGYADEMVIIYRLPAAIQAPRPVRAHLPN